MTSGSSPGSDRDHNNAAYDPYLVIVLRKGQEPVTSITRAIAANDQVPTTPDEAMQRVSEYAPALQEGDTMYVVPSSAVAVYRAKGRPVFVLETSRA